MIQFFMSETDTSSIFILLLFNETVMAKSDQRTLKAGIHSFPA